MNNKSVKQIIMTENLNIHLKWYHTFMFLFQAILTVADVVTDALTCASYLRRDELVRFFIGFALIILPMFVTCIWSIVATTSRTLDRDNEEMSRRETVGGVDVIFRSILLNICLSCSCFGPTLHSLELFLYCARNFWTLWETKGGKEVKKEDGCLYYLYIHNMNMKLVEGLLESGPQLLLQLYVMVEQEQELETIQLVSVSISFLSLTHTVTSSEVLREYSGRELKLWHSIVIFGANVGLMAGRAGAFVFFAVTLGWWLSLIVSVHWLTVVLMGFVLWNSKRIQHILSFVFGHSLLYIFVFRSSLLRNIRSSDKPMSKVTKYFITIVWYFLFAAQNTAMILTYFCKAWKKSQIRCLDEVVLAVVLGGTYGGLLVKSLLWFCCLKHHVPEYGNVDRPRTVTMLVRDQGVRVKNFHEENPQTRLAQTL